MKEFFVNQFSRIQLYINKFHNQLYNQLYKKNIARRTKLSIEIGILTVIFLIISQFSSFAYIDIEGQNLPPYAALDLFKRTAIDINFANDGTSGYSNSILKSKINEILKPKLAQKGIDYSLNIIDSYDKNIYSKQSKLKEINFDTGKIYYPQNKIGPFGADYSNISGGIKGKIDYIIKPDKIRIESFILDNEAVNDKINCANERLLYISFYSDYEKTQLIRTHNITCSELGRAKNNPNALDNSSGGNIEIEFSSNAKCFDFKVDGFFTVSAYYGGHFSYHLMQDGISNLQELKDLTIYSENIKRKSFISENISSMTWRQGTEKYYVDFSNREYSENIYSEGKANSLLNLLDKNISLIKIGDKATKEDALMLIKENNNNGTFIDNKELESAINELAEYIILREEQKLNNKIENGSYVVVTENELPLEFEAGGLDNKTGVQCIEPSAIRTKEYIEVNGGATYSVSENNSGINYVNLYFYNQDLSIVGSPVKVATNNNFTIPVSIAYIKLTCPITNVLNANRLSIVGISSNGGERLEYKPNVVDNENDSAYIVFKFDHDNTSIAGKAITNQAEKSSLSGIELSAPMERFIKPGTYQISMYAKDIPKQIADSENLLQNGDGEMLDASGSPVCWTAWAENLSITNFGTGEAQPYSISGKNSFEIYTKKKELTEINGQSNAELVSDLVTESTWDLNFKSSVESGKELASNLYFESSMELGKDLASNSNFESDIESSKKLTSNLNFESSMESGKELVSNLYFESSKDLALNSNFESDIESSKKLTSNLNFESSVESSTEIALESNFENNTLLISASGMAASKAQANTIQNNNSACYYQDIAVVPNSSYKLSGLIAAYNCCGKFVIYEMDDNFNILKYHASNEIRNSSIPQTGSVSFTTGFSTTRLRIHIFKSQVTLAAESEFENIQDKEVTNQESKTEEIIEEKYNNLKLEAGDILNSQITTYDISNSILNEYSSFLLADNVTLVKLLPNPLFDNYRKTSEPSTTTIYAHRLPRAEFTYQIENYPGDFSIKNLTDNQLSFDLDHMDKANKGIINQIWRWAEIDSDGTTIWHDGKVPETRRFPVGTQVIIWYRVQDSDGPNGIGDWSLPKVVSIDGSLADPSALFVAVPNPLPIQNELTITDQSYSPNYGGFIRTRNWTIKKLSTGVTEELSFDRLDTANNKFYKKFAATGFGQYTITLTVTDNYGKVSKPYSKTITVIDTISPTVSVNQGDGIFKDERGAEITVICADNTLNTLYNRGLKTISYVWSKNSVKPQSTDPVQTINIPSEGVHSKKFVAAQTQEGIWYLYIRDEDYAGNMSNNEGYTKFGPYTVEKIKAGNFFITMMLDIGWREYYFDTNNGIDDNHDGVIDRYPRRNNTDIGTIKMPINYYNLVNFDRTYIKAGYKIKGKIDIAGQPDYAKFNIKYIKEGKERTDTVILTKADGDTYTFEWIIPLETDNKTFISFDLVVKKGNTIYGNEKWLDTWDKRNNSRLILYVKGKATEDLNFTQSH
ncbi:hypothetical protein EHE19_007860 [Ruminiclostridium herbifermentans]|uniref:PKD domain-containing protein n=2 Tax=Ruminiclostridium herbifermentans TaxID=2488810 RepID=A0A7H1VSE8_9FIRM|nr:hypothetical protein EHE19_007860 [Ruminiclostridium herbifermentans]